MLALLSSGDAAVIVAVLGLLAAPTWVQSRRNRRQLTEISNAVNHTPPGGPTLVERIASVEETAAWLVDAHDWNADALVQIAHQVGLKYIRSPPPRPTPTPKDTQ